MAAQVGAGIGPIVFVDFVDCAAIRSSCKTPMEARISRISLEGFRTAGKQTVRRAISEGERSSITASN